MGPRGVAIRRENLAPRRRAPELTQAVDGFLQVRKVDIGRQVRCARLIKHVHHLMASKRLARGVS